MNRHSWDCDAASFPDRPCTCVPFGSRSMKDLIEEALAEPMHDYDEDGRVIAPAGGSDDGAGRGLSAYRKTPASPRGSETVGHTSKSAPSSEPHCQVCGAAMDTSTTAHLHVVEDFSHVGWTCYLDPCPHRPEDTLTAEEFAAVLVRAEKANLVGIAHEVAWYDGPIMGFAITDEVYDLLPDNIRDPRFNP